MARLTVEDKLKVIQAQRAMLDAKERQLLSKGVDEAVAKILKIMKEAELTTAQVVKALSVASAKAGAVAKSPGKVGLGKKAASVAKVKAPKAPKAPKAAKVAKVAPKYRNPDNSEQTWTGRGIPPTWARLMREAGRLDESIIPK